MKVILLTDVKNIGKKDSVCEVNNGYAMNYLIPRKLAVPYTSGSQAVLNKQQEVIAKRNEELKAEAIKTKGLLETTIVEFKAKASPDGRMIGSISYKQVEEELLNKHNIKIDKRKFIDKYQINAFGTTKLNIELFKDIIGVVNVHVSEEK